MSSKKQLRKKRMAEERAQAEARGKMNPALVFTLLILAAVALIAGGVAVFGEEGPGEPPRPGAVWSPEHGHWH